MLDDDADLLGSNTEVAVIVAEPGATAVTNPLALTDATAELLLLQVTASAAPPTTVAVAVSCDVVPTINAAGAAEIATDVTAGAGATVIAALPLLVASNVDVAVIVAFPTPTAVTCPACETVATAAFDVDHVTAVDAPLTAVTVAVSVACVPTIMFGEGAVTTTLVTAGGG